MSELYYVNKKALKPPSFNDGIKNLIIVKNTDLNAPRCKYFIRKNKSSCTVIKIGDQSSVYDYFEHCQMSKHRSIKAAELEIKRLIEEEKNGTA